MASKSEAEVGDSSSAENNGGKFKNKRELIFLSFFVKPIMVTGLTLIKVGHKIPQESFYSSQKFVCDNLS